MDSGENQVGGNGTVFDTGRLKALGSDMIASDVLKDWLTAELDDFERSGERTPQELAIGMRDHCFEALQALGSEQWEQIAVDAIADRPDKTGEEARDGERAGKGAHATA